jgi:hypothetical protein
MSAAFTGLAIFGIAEVLIHAGEKVYELVKAFNGLSEAARKNNAEWTSFSQDTQIANDHLDVTNAKLDVQIAKLQHKPINNLAVALAEARIAADELGKSLQKDIDKQIQLLGKTPWYQLGDNTAGATAKKTQKQLNDLTIVGLGMGANDDTGLTAVRQMDPKAQIQARMDIIRSAIAETQSNIANTATSALRIGYGNTAGDKELAQNKQSLIQYVEELGSLQRKVDELNKQSKVGELEANKTNTPRAIVQPMNNGFAIALAQAQQRVTNAQALVAAESVDNSKRAEALTIAKANMAISKIDAEITAKNLEIVARNAATLKNNPRATPEKLLEHLSADQKQQLQTEALRLAQEELNQTLVQGDNTLVMRIRHQNDLTDAVRVGADAVMHANAQAQAESELAGRTATQAEIAARAELLYEEARAKAHTTATIFLKDKYLELSALANLSAAYLQGAAAVREAERVNAEAKIRAAGGPDVEAKVAASNLQLQLQYQQKIYEAAGQAVNADRDRVTFLQTELSVLKSMDQTAPEVQAAVKQTTTDLIELQDKMALATGTPMAGMKAYFDEMAIHTKTAAQEVHDFLGKAFDDLNDQMAKALLGQKTNWHSFFESMATTTAKAGFKQAESALAKGLGAGNAGSPVSGIANAFGLGGGKPDGSVGNPLNVRVVGGMGIPNLGGGSEPLMVPGGSVADITGGTAPTINTLDGSMAGLMSLSMIPGFASGGDPSPYGLSIVGEDGPELHSNLGGHVTSNSDLRKLLGGQNVYHIDARGANAADVDMRVRKAIAESHVASVRGAVVAQRELNVRRPASRRN